MTGIPYENAVGGPGARNATIKMLERAGADSVGFMDDFTGTGVSVRLVFTFGERRYEFRASASGWAALYTQAHPWSRRSRMSEAAYKVRALEKGKRAVNSAIRDWVKSQLVVIESGVMAFDDVFLPYLLTASGDTVGERARAGDFGDILPPAPEQRALPPAPERVR